MKCKCIHCGNRSLAEISHNEVLHCSRVICNSCEEEFLIRYNSDETEIMLIEPLHSCEERKNMKREELEKLFPKGARVRLVEMVDDPYPVPPGTEGIVVCVDDASQIHVRWANGSSLALIYGVDRFERIF